MRTALKTHTAGSPLANAARLSRGRALNMLIGRPSVAHSWLFHCHNCFHGHSKLSSRMPASPESQLCCLPKTGQEPNTPHPLCASKVRAGGLSARHSLRKGVYPCSALHTYCGAMMAKAVGGRWPRSRTSSPGKSSPWKQAPAHPRRGTAQLSPFTTAQTSDATEGGSRKERIWKEEEGQRKRKSPHS